MCAALVASLLATMLVAAPSVGAQSPFTDGGGRFTVSVPDGWEEDESDDESIAAQFQVPQPLAIFYVSIVPLPEDVSLDAFIPQMLAQLGTESDEFHPAPMADTVMRGEQGKQVDIAAMANGHTVALSQTFAVHDGAVYVLTIATPSPDLPMLMAKATEITGSCAFL